VYIITNPAKNNQKAEGEGTPGGSFSGGFGWLSCMEMPPN